MQAYGVYLSHYLSENLFPNANAIDFALIGGFNFSISMLVAPIVTILARRYGIKVPMIIRAALFSAAHLSASFSTRIWQLYLSQGILLGFGIGFTYIPALPSYLSGFKGGEAWLMALVWQAQGSEG